MNRFLKGVIFAILILSLFSCQKTEEKDYEIFNPFFRIQKNASMEGAGNFGQNGFAIYGFLLIDSQGNINQNTSILDSIEILSPDGKEYQTIKTDQSFEVRSGTGGSGFAVHGINLKAALWMGVDLLSDTKTPPPTGDYQINAIQKNGHKITSKINFKGEDHDPITGYPDKIIFNEKSKTISWNPSKGQTGYRVAIYKGIKQGRPDMSKIVFTSDITAPSLRETRFTLPDQLQLVSNENYYIIVDAFYSRQGDYSHASYVHSQDSDYGQIQLKHSINKIQDSSQPLSLKDVPYPYPVKYANILGAKVAYIDEGKGTPIVFIHGLSTDLNSFSMLFPSLISNGFRIIAFDLPGYGKSSKPQITHTIEKHSQYTTALIEKLNLKKPILVGHSMGGAVSLYIAIKKANLARALILLTPGGTYNLPEGASIYLRSSYDMQFAKRYSDLAVAKTYFKDSSAQWTPELENFMKIRERSMAHPDWKEVQKTIKNSSISYAETNNLIAGQIGKINVPVLAIYGDLDSTIKIAQAQQNIQSKTNNWEVKIAKNCGHMIQYEKRDEVLQWITAFIKNK